MEEAEIKEKDVRGNQSIRKFIGIGVIADKSKLDIILDGISNGFLSEDQINNLREGYNCLLPFRINNYSCLITRGSNFFAFSLAKEVEEFDSPEAQICGLIKEFTAKHEWTKELSKNGHHVEGLRHIEGIRVLINPNTSKKQKYDFSKETRNKNYECEEVGKKFVIESFVFDKENEFELPIGRIFWSVVALLDHEIRESFRSGIYVDLNKKIKDLGNLIFDKSTDVKDFYKNWGKLRQDISYFFGGGWIEDIVEDIGRKSNLEYDLENTRRSFESKIATEAQKSMEKSTKAIKWLTGAIVALTAVLAFAAFLPYLLPYLCSIGIL